MSNVIENEILVNDSSDAYSEVSSNIENETNDKNTQENNQAVLDTSNKRSRIPNRRIHNDDFVTYQITEITNTNPKTVEESLNSADKEHWKRATDEEIIAHHDNESWSKCDVAGAKPIDYKCVFKTKTDLHGNIERHKARLVAKGYAQQYEGTFSPIIRFNSIRFLLALAAKYKLTAVLNPELEEDVILKLPSDYHFKAEVCKLRKAIYELKQASRAWNK